jgi:hypothetical protein
MSHPDFQGLTQADIDEAVRILREDATLEHNRAVLERLDRLEGRVNRMPVKEMSAEEKAAEYDRMMAEHHRGHQPHEEKPSEPVSDGNQDGTGGPPPAPEPKIKEPPATEKARRRWYESEFYGNASSQ